MFKNITYRLKKNKKNAIVLGISCLILIGLILIPFSFAELEPVRSVNIYSKNASYDSNDPGAWRVEKSGKWISRGTAEVTFDVDTKSMIKTSKTDIILVLDTSGSMEEEEYYFVDGKRLLESRINILKYNCRNFLDSIFSSGDNRVALVRFSSDSQILSNLTNDKTNLLRQIDSFTASGETNYYNAFVDVGNILKDYQKDTDRETIVLFLTDGLPNINTPNEVAQYNYLKSQYPWLTINGIQYEMGNVILDPIKKVTDNQFFADSEALNNALLEASVPKLNYEEFSITDYVDTRYFKVEKESDISVNVGKVTFNSNSQNITWKINDLRSGLVLKELRPKMTIKVKLKDELIGKGGVYPTNSREIINTKIENQVENVDSTLTPILADNYKVKYNGNAPSECEVSGVPAEEGHSVFDTVDINEEEPVCEGYKFKGWRIVDNNIEKVGNDRFIMPEKNVEVKAMWGKVELKKSMDGKIQKVQNIYEMMRDNSMGDDQNLSFTSGNIPSTSGVYQYYETRNDDYPVYYYRGEVNNNIKYANMCWKIVRTTETGGTKLIYNGLPAGDGSCNNTKESSTIGNSSFNSSNYSIGNVGYKYGKIYNNGFKLVPIWYSLIGRNKYNSDDMELTNYYYGDGVTYQEGVGYTLANAKQYYWSDHYSELSHYYTCLKEENGVCEKVYFILSSSSEDGEYGYYGPTSSGFYYIEMFNGETYESLYSEAGKVTWKFGNDVVYNAETNSYTLIDPIEIRILAYYKDTMEEDKAKNAHHYTCFNNTDVCNNSVNFIHYYTSDFLPFYMTLQNGTKIEDALKEMTSESTNENKSTILTKIDQWYEDNLKDTEYEKYIEDTVWCNDRSISYLGGWDKDSDNIDSLVFGANGRNSDDVKKPSLKCINEADSFSVGNSKAKLDYPVGLLTADEVTLAGNEKSYLNIETSWWLLSPSYTNFFFYSAYMYIFNYILTTWQLAEGRYYYVRPSIAIEPGAIITTGDGSGNAPFEITYDKV